jgi:hypothetical protein
MDEWRKHLGTLDALEQLSKSLDNPALKALETSTSRMLAELARAAEPLNNISETMRLALESSGLTSESLERFKALAQSIEPPASQLFAELNRATEPIQRLQELAQQAPFCLEDAEPPALHYVDLSPPALSQEPSPAVETVQRIEERLQAERAEKETPRRVVIMVVTLLDGARLLMENMSNEGKNLIRIRGIDMATEVEREVIVGPQAIQIEFFTVEKPPPDLRLVE